MNLCGTVKIESERFILRRITLEDAEDMYNNWASDENVTRNLTWPCHNSIDITKKVIKMWLEDYKRNDNFQWGIELKEKNKLIGCISVVRINENIEEVALGYCLGSKFWNKGIMTQVLSLVMKFFFETVGVNRIEAYHKIENVASGKVMIKNNMKCEGVRRAGSKNYKGEYSDVVVYAILRNEYKVLGK